MTNLDRVIAYVVLGGLLAMLVIDVALPTLIDIFNKFCHQDAQHWFKP